MNHPQEKLLKPNPTIENIDEQSRAEMYSKGVNARVCFTNNANLKITWQYILIKEHIYVPKNKTTLSRIK